MRSIDFHEPALARLMEGLTHDEIDRLPFGVIRLDPEGVVLFYSQTERDQSGLRGRASVGLNFFLEIAPCMNTPAFRGRIEAAQKLGQVDIEMGWIGDFADRERELLVRIQSASDGGMWVFLSRDVDPT